MRLLLTGGTGFLGKHVHLPSNYTVWRPSSQELNLLDKDEAVRKVVDFKPDVILHLAARTGGILASKNHPVDFVHPNMDMASNIFHAALKSNCPTIYTVGSVCAYPKHCPVPFKEDDLWNGYPEETNAPYGCAKRMLLILQQSYRQQYGIKGAHFLMVNLYGEHDNFDLQKSHVIPALIVKCLQAKKNGAATVDVWGDGLATREFIYASDAAEALLMSVEQSLDYEQPINLGSGRDISIHDLAELIKELTGYQGQMVFNGGLNGQPKRLLDVSRAKKLIGFEAQTNFREGLVRTIDWFKSNHKEYE